MASLLLTPCAEVEIRDQSGQERGRDPQRSAAAAFLLSRLLSDSCRAAPLQGYSESIQQPGLSAVEEASLLSAAKSV